MVILRGYGVNIRSEPEGRIIGTIGRGGEVASALKHFGGWTQYQFGYFTGWVYDDVHSTIVPEMRRHDVEWVSQLGSGADLWGGDCGAACLVMLLEAYLNIRPSVDEVAALFQFSEVKRYGFISDIIRAAAAYNLPMSSSRTADLYHTVETLLTRPAIQLIDYDLLPSRYDPNYRAGHYVVVYAMDAQHVYALDPYDRHRREHKLTWEQWRDVISFSRYNAPTQAVIPGERLKPSIRSALLSFRDRVMGVVARV